MRHVVDAGLCDTDYLLYSTGGGDGKTLGIASNGRAYYRITIKGKTSHTGRNEMGVNAAVKAAKLIARLEELRHEVNNRRVTFQAGDVEIEGRGRFSINLVHAFTTGNNVPDLCTIQIDRRLIPQHETYEGGQAEIQAVVDQLKREDPEFDADVAWNPERWMNFSVSVPDSPLVKTLQKSVKKVLGFIPTIGTGPTGGSSDHGWFKLKYPDRPFVSYGLGRGGNSHTYDEYVTIDGLIDNTKVYALLMMDLLGVA
jgi:acetylornithine deacetylase/succinyl-diaminopimelate desuccinylase-like protein